MDDIDSIIEQVMLNRAGASWENAMRLCDEIARLRAKIHNWRERVGDVFRELEDN